jgi:hypothetical protein
VGFSWGNKAPDAPAALKALNQKVVSSCVEALNKLG